MTEKPLGTRHIFAGVLSAAVALVSAFSVYGEKARVVHILTIFAGGLGAGVTLGPILRLWRQRGRGSGT